MSSDLQKQAFSCESLRHIISKNDNTESISISNLYNKKLPEIGIINPGEYWDEVLGKQVVANNTNHIEKHRIHIICKEIIRLSADKNRKLLDVGFGNGLVEHRVNSRKNIKLHGVDVSRYAVKKARISYPGVFKLGGITKIPFKDNMFDIVVASEVLEHVPPSSTFQALLEIKRVLKPKGYFLLSIPVNENLEEMIIERGINPNLHARSYTKDIVRMELKINGFIVYHIDELYAFSNSYWVKTIFIKLLRLISYNLSSRVQVNNIIIFAQKK